MIIEMCTHCSAHLRGGHVVKLGVSMCKKDAFKH